MIKREHLNTFGNPSKGMKLKPSKWLLAHLASRPMWNSVEVGFYEESPYVVLGDYEVGSGWYLHINGGFTGGVPDYIVQHMELYEE